MVYTTASDAIVAPKLKLGETESRLMYGSVASSFGNTKFIEDNCNTPIAANTDPNNSGITCIEIQHSGEAYHNYMQFLATWVENIHTGNGSTNLTMRPDPVGVCMESTLERPQLTSYSLLDALR